MALGSFLAVLLIIAVPGNADVLSGTLLDRIEALERRDTEQFARTDLLEEQALVSKEKMDFLSASNDNLQKQLYYQAKKMKEQDNFIADLRKEAEHHKTANDKCKKHVTILESKMKKMDVEIEKMDKMFAKMEENHQEEVQVMKYRKMKTDTWTDKTETLNGESLEPTIATTGNEDTGDLEMEKEGLPKIRTQNIDFEKVKALDNGTKNTLHKPTNGQLGWNEIKQHAVRSLTVPVAFHAVRVQDTDQHPQINDAVKFESVLLNQGNGYHDQHGLFIAPQSGTYLFSTSIMCTTLHDHLEVQASIVKNGANLVRVYCYSTEGKGHDQGSATVITQLNTADEIWVRFDMPDGGYILGYGFTSFSGIQIM